MEATAPHHARLVPDRRDYDIRERNIEFRAWVGVNKDRWLHCHSIHTKLLTELSFRRTGKSLTSLQFPSWKLPKPTVSFMARAATDKE